MNINYSTIRGMSVDEQVRVIVDHPSQDACRKLLAFAFACANTVQRDLPIDNPVRIVLTHAEIEAAKERPEPTTFTRLLQDIRAHTSEQAYTNERSGLAPVAALGVQAYPYLWQIWACMDAVAAAGAFAAINDDTSSTYYSTKTFAIMVMSVARNCRRVAADGKEAEDIEEKQKAMLALLFM